MSVRKPTQSVTRIRQRIDNMQERLCGDTGDAATMPWNLLRTQSGTDERRCHAPRSRWRTQPAPPPHCTDLNPPRAKTTGELSELSTHDITPSPKRITLSDTRMGATLLRPHEDIHPSRLPSHPSARMYEQNPCTSEWFQCTSYCHLR